MRLLLRHAFWAVATLALLIGLSFTASPAVAQAGQQALKPSDISATSIPSPDPITKNRGGLIQDPSFEATPAQLAENPFWDSFSAALPGTPFVNNTTFGVELSRTGNYFAIFGFADATGTDFIEQTVTLAEAGDYELTFYFAGGIDADDDGTVEAEGTLRALVDGTAVYELTAEDAPAYSFDYNEVTVPVSVAAAGDVVVRIELEVIANPGTDDVYQVFLDDVTLEASAGGGDTIIDTEVVQTEVLPDGYFGAAGGAGTGFVFNGDNGLYEGQLLVGLNASTVYGDPYGPNEWVSVSEPMDVTPPDGFDDAVEAVFESTDGNVTVTVLAYGATGDPYVYLEYEVENTSGAALEDVYVGPFADFDAGDFAENVGGYDDDQNLVYVSDNSGTSTNFFGVLALESNSAPVSGWNVTAGTDDAGLYAALTTDGTQGEAPDDRRAVIGVGPYSIADGASVTATFAVLGGADLDEILANADAIQGGGPLEEAIHDTGTVQFEVFDNGEIGATSGIGTGFVFDGDQGLFEGTFLVGQSLTQVSGDLYEEPDFEWVTVDPIMAITPPTDFDQAFEAAYDDSGAADPIGVEVTQQSYSATGDAFVIMDFNVENTSGSDLTGIYLGVFADWDAGDFTQNVGGYDENTQLLYVSDASNTSTNYFGVAALDRFEDVDVSGVFYEALPGDDVLYLALTNISPDATIGADRRTVLGVGPYDIAAGASVDVQFAFVGGGSLDDIIDNAALAQGFPVAVEETTQAGTFTLHSAYPNPLSSTTTLGFSLPTAQHVKLAVYDMLGRQVATLIDGLQQAGAQSVEFDASALPSGVYFYRLDAEGAQLAERFTVMR